jgi:NDP-4-keto-2,6-dideoxyhexose 3-C-methyltransferase
MLEGTIQQAGIFASGAADRPTVKTRATCRSCGSGNLDAVLDLGNHYVSNFPDVPDGSRLPRVPLELLLCANCTLLQLRHTVPSEWLYRRYWYKSGINSAMCRALADIARCASEFVELAPGDAVLDIGANDGTLLRSYSTKNLRRVGFEPAENLAGEAANGTDRIIPDFFNARWLTGEQFRVITSIAMFYDLEDPNAFVADVAKLLARDGLWVIEMHYLTLTLARNAFDAVCHEHLEYYSLLSLEPLLARHNLAVADVSTNEVNGGSFRVYVVHAGSSALSDSARHARVEAVSANEKAFALEVPETYERFGGRIWQIGGQLTDWLVREVEQEREVYLYGASTKGNTLLQVFGIGHSLIRGAAERNPDKWGKYTVGSWIPIISEKEARVAADDFLILPWHFLADIREREREFVAKGGKLIAPLPEPRIIDAKGIRKLI